jgi:hypothetical protein
MGGGGGEGSARNRASHASSGGGPHINGGADGAGTAAGGAPAVACGVGWDGAGHDVVDTAAADGSPHGAALSPSSIASSSSIAA